MKSRAKQVFYYTIRLFALILLKPFCQWKVIGQQNLPQKGAFIIAANHSSPLDGFILAASFKRQLIILSAAYLFKIPGVGPFLRGVGAIPVKKGQPDLTAIKKTLKVLRKGEIVVVFPQGGVTPTPLETNAIKRGVAYLASKANVPLVPVGIQGTDAILPLGKKLPRPGKVVISIGKPIYFNNWSSRKKTDTSSTITNAILQLTSAEQVCPDHSVKTNLSPPKE